MNSEPETLKSSADFNVTGTYLTPTKEIKWTVPDMESLPKDPGYALDSPLFFFQNAIWCLRLYPVQKTRMRLCVVRLSSHVPHHRLLYHLESEHGGIRFFGRAADFDENRKENGDMEFTLREEVHPVFRVKCLVSCYGGHVEDVFSQTRSLNGAQKNSKLEMIKSDGDFNQTETHMIPTKEITWTVRDFNSLPEDSGFSLDSPPFVFRKATWCLRLYPHQIPFDNIGLYIVRLSSHVPHHRLQYHFTSLDYENLNCVNFANFWENYQKFEIYRFAKSFVTQKKNFRVTCQISDCVLHNEDALSQTQHFERDMKDIGDLCLNFKNLLLNGKDHDVVLKVKEKEFRAHQNILRARSPVLDSMLSHDMTEKNSGVIDIPDCDPGAFDQFLLYLYTGEVEALDAGNMLSLYYIADKYDMGHLKDKCRQFSKRSMTCTNVSDVIQTALDHSDADLLESATEYFVKHVKAVLRTAEWQSFAKRNIIQANELFIKAADYLDNGTI